MILRKRFDQNEQNHPWENKNMILFATTFSMAGNGLHGQQMFSLMDMKCINHHLSRHFELWGVEQWNFSNESGKIPSIL